MTTVYVNKRLGIAITDSRVTTTVPRFFAGFFPLTSRSTCSVATQKALYIHDRLFLATGNVAVIDRIAQYISTGKYPFINKDDSCDCLWMHDEYAVQFLVQKGKMKKKVLFFGKSFEYSMGSGSEVLWSMIDHKGYPTTDDVFNAFRKVTEYDFFTDDNINLYRI